MHSYPKYEKYAQPTRWRAIAITAIGLPIGLFAGYVVLLVVPEVLRVVVPAVVEAVVSR